MDGCVSRISYFSFGSYVLRPCSQLLLTVPWSALPLLTDRTQHCRVRIVLGTAPALQEYHAWIHPTPGAPCWNSILTQEFLHWLPLNIDRAWSIWHQCSGGHERNSYVKGESIQGSWVTAGKDRAVNGLWRKQRKALAEGTPEGDAVAYDCLRKIQLVLKANSTHNLKDWKERVQTRSGAAAWIKRRLALLTPVVLPLFGQAHLSFADAASHFASQLAPRWNVGCHILDLDGRL